MLQYRVTWFPSYDKASESKTLAEKTEALRIFKNAKEAG